MNNKVRLHTGKPRNKSALELIGSITSTGHSEEVCDDIRFLAFRDANNKIRDSAKDTGASDIYELKYSINGGLKFCECQVKGVMYKMRV